MHHCDICETNQTEGIFIYHLFMCDHCQKQVIATDPEDPNYHFFVNKLKKMQQTTLNN